MTTDRAAASMWDGFKRMGNICFQRAGLKDASVRARANVTPATRLWGTFPMTNVSSTNTLSLNPPVPSQHFPPNFQCRLHASCVHVSCNHLKVLHIIKKLRMQNVQV